MNLWFKHSLGSAQEVMGLKKCPTKEHAGVKDLWRHSSCVAGACLVHVFRAVYCDVLPKKLFCSSYLIASTQATSWIFFCKLMIAVVSLNLARSLKTTTYLSLNLSRIQKITTSSNKKYVIEITVSVWKWILFII